MSSTNAKEDVLGVVTIGPSAGVSVRRDGEWVIVHVNDGNGSDSTISLTPSQAIDLATLLRGSAIIAAGVKR